MSKPTVMRKLIQAYTDEAGQVVVDPAIIKAVQDETASTSLQLEHRTTQDLLLRRCWKNWQIHQWELWNLIWVGLVCHFSARNRSSSLSASLVETAGQPSGFAVKANEMGIPSLTVTNVPGSTLSREANHTMLLHAGPEIAGHQPRPIRRKCSPCLPLQKQSRRTAMPKRKPLTWFMSCQS